MTMQGRARTAALAALAAMVLGASGAGAWEYPLLPHVPAMAIWPVPPNNAQSTTVVLSAVYSGECWSLADAQVGDSAHINVTLRPGSVPADSACGWVHEFDLGVLAAGSHALSIHATVLPAGQAPIAEDITVPFDVMAWEPPPPPPPPSDSGQTLVNGMWLEPGAPQLGERVTLHLRGRYPFDCGRITDARVVDEANIALTLSPGGCGDTLRAWSQDLDLGTPAAGSHSWLLDVTAERAGVAQHEYLTVAVNVLDPDNPPPPPPPPIDSLRAMMSASHPNPFREESRFSVSLEDPQPAEVAVFDVGGRRVATVFRGMLPNGTSQLAWNGRRADGTRASGGLYFYRLTLPDRVVTRRVVLLGTP